MLCPTVMGEGEIQQKKKLGTPNGVPSFLVANMWFKSRQSHDRDQKEELKPPKAI